MGPTETVPTLAALLLVTHFLLDFPLQGDFLSKAKNPNAPIPGVPWQWAMAAHSCIQGGGVAACVYLVTGNLWAALLLGAAEIVMHGFIDTLKCLNAITFGQDQTAHLACKGAWIILLVIATGA